VAKHRWSWTSCTSRRSNWLVAVTLNRDVYHLKEPAGARDSLAPVFVPCEVWKPRLQRNCGFVAADSIPRPGQNRYVTIHLSGGAYPGVWTPGVRLRWRKK